MSVVTASSLPTPVRCPIAPPMASPLFAPLAARLDAVLTAMPVVATLGRDAVVDTLLVVLGLARAGLIARRIRVHDGRSLVIVAVPAETWISSHGKAAVLALKRAARDVGRRVLVVPEGALSHDSRLADALLIADCAGIRVAASDRVALTAALSKAGGAMPLSDAAAIMVRADDPVAAVLSLVAGHVVGIDLYRAIGPETQILDLAGRTWILRGQRR